MTNITAVPNSQVLEYLCEVLELDPRKVTCITCKIDASSDVFTINVEIVPNEQQVQDTLTYFGVKNSTNNSS